MFRGPWLLPRPCRLTCPRSFNVSPIFQGVTGRASLPKVTQGDNDTAPLGRTGEEALARLRRNGSDIHHEAHGFGAPVLFTHGFGATCRMWDEQIEELTDGYRLILWDLPGHGDSGKPRRVPTLNSVVRDMLAVLNAAKAERVVLAGLGIGGLMALRFWR